MLKWLKFEMGVTGEEFRRFERSMLDDVMQGDDPKWFNLRCSLVNLGLAEDGASAPSISRCPDLKPVVGSELEKSATRCVTEPMPAWARDATMNVACN